MGQLEAEEGGGDVGGDVRVGFPLHHAQEGSASMVAPALPTASPQTGLGSGGQHALGSGGVRSATARSVGPAEYLQWLGDMSSMLVHEQWRKEVHDTKLVCFWYVYRFVFHLGGGRPRL